MRLKDLTIEVEGIPLKGRAYLPPLESERGRWKKEPLLILCHGIPRGGPSPYVYTDELEQDCGEGRELAPKVAPDPDPEPGPGEDGGYPALAERCFAEGFPCFHFNFRGTGESGGDFDLKGWMGDLRGVLDYWEQKESHQGGFYLWGFSAGAAVSCCVAAADPRVRGVVLAAGPAEFGSLFPRANLRAILGRFRETGLFRDPSFPADPEQWLDDLCSVNPLNEIHKIAPRPLLLIHGTGDDVVPYEHARKLNKAARANRVRNGKANKEAEETGTPQSSAGEPNLLITLPGAGHQLRRDPEAVAKCIAWLKTL